MSAYSVQQLLFDCMSYLKEFGGEGRVWEVGLAQADAIGAREGFDVWLHRPALSPRAAETVAHRLRNRFNVLPLPASDPSGRYLFLGRRHREGSDSAEKPPAHESIRS